MPETQAVDPHNGHQMSQGTEKSHMPQVGIEPGPQDRKANTLPGRCKSRLPSARQWKCVIFTYTYYSACPSWESNPGRWIYRQTLNHVTVKAGFYRKAVEVYYIYLYLLHIDTHATPSMSALLVIYCTHLILLSRMDLYYLKTGTW